MQAWAGAKTHGVPNRNLKHCADSKNSRKARTQKKKTASRDPTSVDG